MQVIEAHRPNEAARRAFGEDLQRTTRALDVQLRELALDPVTRAGRLGRAADLAHALEDAEAARGFLARFAPTATLALQIAERDERDGAGRACGEGALPEGLTRELRVLGCPGPGLWLDAHAAARVVGDGATLEALLALPHEYFRREPDFLGAPERELARAVRALEAGTPIDLEAGRKAAGHALRRKQIGEYLDALVLPVFDAVEAFDADAEARDAALGEALERHRRYWKRAKRMGPRLPAFRDHGRGYASWRVSGLVALAGARGAAPALRSEYLFANAAGA